MPAPTKAELIEAARAKLDADGPTDFARKLGLDVGGYLKVYRWENRNGRLDWEDAARMLEALGWLQTEPAPADLAEEFVRRLESGERVSRRQIERVATQIEELSEQYRLLAERLRAGIRAAAK